MNGTQPENIEFSDEDIRSVKAAIKQAQDDMKEYREKSRVPYWKMIRPVTNPKHMGRR